MSSAVACSPLPSTAGLTSPACYELSTTLSQFQCSIAPGPPSTISPSPLHSPSHFTVRPSHSSATFDPLLSAAPALPSLSPLSISPGPLHLHNPPPAMTSLQSPDPAVCDIPAELPVDSVAQPAM
ncbi:hypothetical protein BDN67DRAFT_973139 [Paxillus ammoniavirescens]|nr:hypothetical protein BDN67DRAFT_973139 [Paxillus ammoniavirescens]